MNKDEARQLLLRRLEPLLLLGYSELCDRVGREDVIREVGPSGVEYFLEVCVEYVNEDDPTIDVIGYAHECDGRLWLPPTVGASFGVTESGRMAWRTGWPE